MPLAVNGEFFSCHRCSVHGDVVMFASILWGEQAFGRQAQARRLRRACLVRVVHFG